MIKAIPATVRLADTLPRVSPTIANLKGVSEFSTKVNTVSTQWKMNVIQSHEFPIVKQLSTVNQQANEIASGLSKSIKVSNHAAASFLDSFRASSLVVSEAVLEFTERNRILTEKINERFKLLPEAFLVLGDHGWYLNLDFELSIAV